MYYKQYSFKVKHLFDYRDLYDSVAFFYRSLCREKYLAREDVFWYSQASAGHNFISLLSRAISMLKDIYHTCLFGNKNEKKTNVSCTV